MSRRVVTTGVGLISSVGLGTDATWAGVCAGQSGIGPLTRFEASQHASRLASEVKGFDPLNFVEKKEVKKIDLFIQFAIAASQFAVDDAKLEVTAATPFARRPSIARWGHCHYGECDLPAFFGPFHSWNMAAAGSVSGKVCMNSTGVN